MKRQIPLFLLLLGSAYPGFSQQRSNSPALPVDSFFSDSGLGFDGHYNRCVWVCCTKGLRPGDTIQIIKLCGGMIGACPKSWTLHHWHKDGWHLEYSRNYLRRRSRRVTVFIRKEGLDIRLGRTNFLCTPVSGLSTQFQRYMIRKVSE